MVSESHDCNLIDVLPSLLKSNNDNEYISLLIVYDLLKILKNLYQQHENLQNLNVDGYQEQTNNNKFVQIVFDLKSFVIKNGRLKYCPSLISAYHNVQEVETQVQNNKFENLIFVNKLIVQFMVNSNKKNNEQLLYAIMPMIVDRKNP